SEGEAGRAARLGPRGKRTGGHYRPAGGNARARRGVESSGNAENPEQMIRHLLLRFLFTLPALWLILTMVFLLVHIVPGDPVQQMLGEGARAEDMERLHRALGLDLPLHVQYGRYLAGLLRGNWGQSFRFQTPVLRVVLERYPATITLALTGLLICAAIGIPAGVLAAHRRGHATDRAVGFFTLLGLSVPNFALGPVLILLFSIQLGWLPVSGKEGWASLVLPGTTVTETIFSWPGIGRLTVQAIQARDYPLLQGCILVIAFSYVVVNLLTDFIYALADPRIRLQ